MTEIKSVKFPLHQNKARVYDAAGKYLFWISLAGESNALDELRERGEGWLDFRNRTQPMRDALEVEELSIAKHFVDAINAFESNEAALAAKDAEIETLRAEAKALQDLNADAHGIVARIWSILGNPSYDDLNGRTIYDLVQQQRARAEKAEVTVSDLMQLVIQYRDDLHHPPSPDSVERRLKAIEAALAGGSDASL